MSRPTVLLADDHTLLLEAYRDLLEEEYEIVGAVSDGAALVEEAGRLRPDVIVTDESMPRMGGIEAARRLRDLVPATRVVFVTVNDDPAVAAEAFRLGAKGWVLKTSTVAELSGAVRAAVAGKPFLTARIEGGDIDALPQPRPPGDLLARLTPREREVLQLLAEGKLMKEAAAVLGITTRTVAFHKYRMMETLGIHSSAELIQFAAKSGLV